jgi:hypothetical protein
MVNENNKHKNTKRSKIIALVLLTLVLAVGVYTYIHLRAVHVNQSRSGHVASVQKSTNANGAVSQAPTSELKEKPGSNPPSSTATELLAPSGNFVSNHKPGQNGTSTAMQSVCNTSPGATCNIIFTNSAGVIKELGPKTTDATGSALWTWDINGSELGPGDWKVTAVAKLSSQTMTTDDTIKLEVQ